MDYERKADIRRKTYRGERGLKLKKYKICSGHACESVWPLSAVDAAERQLNAQLAESHWYN